MTKNFTRHVTFTENSYCQEVPSVINFINSWDVMQNQIKFVNFLHSLQWTSVLLNKDMSVISSASLFDVGVIDSISL